MFDYSVRASQSPHDLDQARRRAKELLRAARAGDVVALRRLEQAGAAPSLSGAQRAIAEGYGFASWPALVRASERFSPVDLRDVDWRRIREISVVCFADQDEVVLSRRHGRLSLPHGRVAPGEDVWDDTVRRVPMTSAGFRHQGTHVFAIDRAHRHAIFWVDGALDDRTTQDVHTSATALGVAEAVRSLEAQGDFALARLVASASDHRRQMTYEQHQRDGDRTTVNFYLRASTPQGGSGYDGSDEEWRAARACLAVALDGLAADLGRADNSVSFLDVGCANGHLPASFVTWGAERGVTVDPYGIDIVPELIDRARKLHPHWADHFWTGNMLNWQHPKGKVFDLVHVLLDGVPPDKFAEAISNCASLVTPGGRLLVSSYDMRSELAAETVMTQLGIHVDGHTPPRSRQGGMPGQPSVWTRIAPGDSVAAGVVPFETSRVRLADGRIPSARRVYGSRSVAGYETRRLGRDRHWIEPRDRRGYR